MPELCACRVKTRQGRLGSGRSRQLTRASRGLRDGQTLAVQIEEEVMTIVRDYLRVAQWVIQLT